MEISNKNLAIKQQIFMVKTRLSVTTPTQGTVCNPSAKTLHSKPVYKI